MVIILRRPDRSRSPPLSPPSDDEEQLPSQRSRQEGHNNGTACSTPSRGTVVSHPSRSAAHDPSAEADGNTTSPACDDNSAQPRNAPAVIPPALVGALRVPADGPPMRQRSPTSSPSLDSSILLLGKIVSAVTPSAKTLTTLKAVSPAMRFATLRSETFTTPRPFLGSVGHIQFCPSIACYATTEDPLAAASSTDMVMPFDNQELPVVPHYAHRFSLDVSCNTGHVLPTTDLSRKLALIDGGLVKLTIAAHWSSPRTREVPRLLRSVAPFAPDLTELDLGDASSATLRALAHLPQLRVLVFRSYTVTTSWASLDRLPALEWLDVSGSMQLGESMAAFKAISRLPSLRVLLMKNCGIRNAQALQHFSASKAPLELIDLRGNGVGVPHPRDRDEVDGGHADGGAPPAVPPSPLFRPLRDPAALRGALVQFLVPVAAAHEGLEVLLDDSEGRFTLTDGKLGSEFKL